MKTFLMIAVHACFLFRLCAAPEIAVEDNHSSINFGKYPAKDEKKAVFKIRNTGDEVLKILSTRMTCGCFASAENPTEIKARETKEFKFMVKPESILGPFSKNIYIESNDPKNKFLALVMGGEAIPVATVKPSALINAGRISDTQAFEQEFLVEGTEKGVVLGKPVIKSEHKAEIIVKESIDESKLSFVLRLDPLKETGDMKFLIHVSVIKPEGWKNIEIILTGKTGNVLCAVPSNFFLSLGKEDIEQNFQLRVQGAPDFKINPDLISWEKIEGVEFSFEKSNTSSGAANAKVRFSKEFIKKLLTSEQKEILIRLGLPGAVPAELKIKIKE